MKSLASSALRPLWPLFLLVLAGCSLLPGAEPVAVQRYALGPLAATPAGNEATGPTLLLAAPRALAEVATPRMLYQREGHRLAYFAYSRWADEPARMLAERLVEALEDSGRLAAVVRPGTPVQADLRLETELLAFVQDFHQTPSRFHIRLRARLVDPVRRRVVASRLFTAEAEAPSDDPAGGAAAAERASRSLAGEVVAFVLRQLPIER
ncbi:ABC-type transport auxiliary lipoprotein family protein [Thiohalobacter sp. IOR34]|uniref:ABC-type transport auxiliary lipoprotein family protein n=1 Tax=Thiohalobacter sp. IOR34 TaxID=3057176 RepID=UPI0025B0E4E9|nr:ABC-type transport auxiliary lipoprotein family protein [Thiohalobacter sp. IOR34]WJW76252.1 ABC-type transport auxiliary lipoprotein family protein [Thiohalobacter sp. IOR34]